MKRREAWNIYQALNEVDDALLEETHQQLMQPAVHKKRKFLRPLAVAAAVAVCVVGAAAAALPNLPVVQRIFGDSAMYQQCATEVGQFVTSNGWTLTCTDFIADDYNIYAGFELEAPEGTDLSEMVKTMETAQSDFTIGGYINTEDLSSGRDDGQWSGGWSAHFLEDEDPNDNILRFVYCCDGAIYNESGFDPNGSILGREMTISFTAFGTWSEGNEFETAVEGNWTFQFEIPNSDTSLCIEPNTPVELFGSVEANVATVKISPLGAYIYLNGETLRNHHDLVDNPIPRGSCTLPQYTEVILYTKDGTAIPMQAERSGGGCEDCKVDTEREPYICLMRSVEETQYHNFTLPSELLNVEELEALSINGTIIPLN